MSDQDDPHVIEPRAPEVDSQDNTSQPVAQEKTGPLQEMQGYIDAQSDPDAKLALAIGFMEKALAQSGSPQFRIFWELRKRCQEFFRESLPPGVRTTLWARYTELSDEARRLKGILNEQTEFAVEQIEMAVKGIEEDLERIPQLIENTPKVPLPVYCQALESRESTYQAIQHELNLLNASASRVNALRKELIKTDMRIGQKNRLFQRLSAAGDRIFPRRKELIKTMSDAFTSDVDQFIAVAFGKGPGDALAGIREEIKSLQTMAKTLTLNTQSFNSTRKHLSECWDKLKEVQKTQRQERIKKQAIHREKETIRKPSPERAKPTMRTETKAEPEVEVEEECDYSIPALSDSGSEALEQLQRLLVEREAQRTQSRAKLEHLRKASGQSGRDFEQALRFSTQQAEARARLERIEDSIDEIIDKIDQLENE